MFVFDYKYLFNCLALPTWQLELAREYVRKHLIFRSLRTWSKNGQKHVFFFAVVNE